MNKTYNLYKFYASLIFLYISDMGAMIGIIWASLEITQSPLFLGVMLGISSLVPYLIRNIFAHKLSLTLNHLYVIRLFIYLIILIIALMGFADNFYGLIITILLFGIINVLTMGTYETYNSYAVNSAYITSEFASRIMQTVLQSGAFLGAIIAGFLLNKLGYIDLIKTISLYEISLNFIFYFLNRSLFPLIHTQHKEKTQSPVEYKKQLYFIYLLCIPLGMIGLHISSFNILSTVIFQKINNWDPILFGYASGIAGIGAFLASIINIKKLKLLFYAITLATFDFIYSNTDYSSVALIACFIIGFSINSIRIQIRKNMLDIANTPELSQKMGEFSAFSYVFVQSIGSVVIGLLISDSLFGSSFSKYLFPLIGVTLFLSISIIYSIIRRKSI